MKQRIRYYFMLVALVLSLGGLCASYLWSTHSSTADTTEWQVIPARTKVAVHLHDDNLAVVTPQSITRLLPFKLSDTTLTTFDTHQIESTILSKGTGITSASVYVAPLTHTLHIEVEAELPLLRYYVGGRSFYLNDKGKSFPYLAGTAAYVPLATGAITPEAVTTLLYPLALYLREHEELSAFITGIHLPAGGGLLLYPRVGDYVFELSDVESLDESLPKIEIFYKEILPRVGAEKYRLIKLSYRNQIVCQQRNKRSH